MFLPRLHYKLLRETSMRIADIFRLSEKLVVDYSWALQLKLRLLQHRLQYRQHHLELKSSSRCYRLKTEPSLGRVFVGIVTTTRSRQDDLFMRKKLLSVVLYSKFPVVGKVRSPISHSPNTKSIFLIKMRRILLLHKWGWSLRSDKQSFTLKI